MTFSSKLVCEMTRGLSKYINVNPIYKCDPSGEKYTISFTTKKIQLVSIKSSCLRSVRDTWQVGGGCHTATQWHVTRDKCCAFVAAGDRWCISNTRLQCIIMTERRSHNTRFIIYTDPFRIPCRKEWFVFTSRKYDILIKMFWQILGMRSFKNHLQVLICFETTCEWCLEVEFLYDCITEASVFYVGLVFKICCWWWSVCYLRNDCAHFYHDWENKFHRMQDRALLCTVVCMFDC